MRYFRKSPIDMKILAIGYGKNLFTTGHPEQLRQLACATVVDEYHMIVFARTSEGLKSQQIGNFFLYPTGGKTRFGMVVRAFLLGRQLVRQSKLPTDFVVTAQDPFEAGLVGYLIARFCTLSLNLQEHGDFFSAKEWRRESVVNRIRFVLGKWLLRRADTVRVVSTRMLATMQQIGVSPTKLRLLSVEVPLQRFLQAPPSAVARQLFPPDSLIILTVARLVPQKNLSLLLRAFTKVVAETPQARLLIIGTGPEQQKLIARATEFGLLGEAQPLVRFLPWTDDVPSYMQSADMYALSSNYEGYARVLPEAMASGLGVVTTDVGCAHEVVVHGQHGLIVPVADEVAFTAALVTLSTNAFLRQQCGQAAHTAMESVATTPTEPYANRWRAALQ